MDERPANKAGVAQTGGADGEVAAYGVPAALFGEIERCAGAWATEAGEHLSAQVRGGLHIEYKGNNSTQPVSEADREAEEFLYQAVHRRFADHSVIGEEGRDPGLERTPFVWVIDPLDG